MNHAMSHSHRAKGFVLVTSLVFLAVMTLLVISAVNSSTLQERMSSNQREKSRARQASETALREAELRLGGTNFETYKPAGGCYGANSGSSNCGASDAIRIWRQGEVIPNGNASNPASYLADNVWSQSGIQSMMTEDNTLAPTRFAVEELDRIDADDLNPSTSARGQGQVLYRITARARGQNPAASAVSRSIFVKRYYGSN